jgi:two-component system, chemotaxis family, protein-glutamate methylesterase/glutaminase
MIHMTGADFRVVALVCSAGGLNALTHVLAALPADLPAAVIALQHHDPAQRSMLAAILARRTRLPVTTAVDGDRIVPGRVLVAPAGQHLLATAAGTVALIASGAIPPARPSADLLLTSLALTAGARTIAVVLSGYGSDGATGATAVHHFGGTVIATDEATSTQYAMPAATIGRPAITDHVVALDSVAELLTALVATSRESPG